MILASQSPRRKELLGYITKDFKVIPAVGEEKVPEGTSPKDTVLMLSRQKAEEILAQHKGETIIAADTIVAVDGEILGKPRGEAHAAEMLGKLSGRVHSVFTGVCVIFADGTRENFAEETKVEFYPLSEREIADYIATGDPMDKAGAYGIQEKGAANVKGIVGDFYNVMGLPVGRLARVLREHTHDIRLVAEENIPECVEVIRRSFQTVADEFGFTAEKDPKFTSYATTVERLRRHKFGEKRPMYAYFIDGKIAGYYSLHINGGEIELSNLAVLPEYRRRKVGESLMLHSFDRARELGFSEIIIGVVEQNKRVIRWYESYGFQKSGDCDEYDTFHCIYMKRAL